MTETVFCAGIVASLGGLMAALGVTAYRRCFRRETQ